MYVFVVVVCCYFMKAHTENCQYIFDMFIASVPNLVVCLMNQHAYVLYI